MIELNVIEYNGKAYISFDQLDDILLRDSLRFTKERSKLDDPSLEIVGASINVYIRDLRNRLIESTIKK